jgi:acetoacetate decarboxylase
MKETEVRGRAFASPLNDPAYPDGVAVFTDVSLFHVDQVLRTYQRRTLAADALIAGNTRRVRRALGDRW